MLPNFANLIGSMIFSCIGFAAFMYGKKQSSFKAIGIGIVLMVFPYFISNTIAMYGVGALLIVALFAFPDFM